MKLPLEIHPARAKSRSPDDLWNHPSWVLEEKLDGWRWLMHFGGGLERPHLTGRRVGRNSGTLSEKGLLVPQIWPGGRSKVGYTVLDGEVMPPAGASFRDMAGLMNADVETAQARIAEIGPPTYCVFDILFFDGRDVREESLIGRRRYLEKHSGDAWFQSLVQNELIRLVPQLPSYESEYDAIVANGGEGVILKDICSAYGDKDGWVKVKKFTTLDVIVTGFTDARMGRTGKYLGQIGAARVSVRDSSGGLVEVGQVSGMTDDVRRHMTDHPEQWLGTVIEIAAQEFAVDRLRHPRFKRARPDANPTDATWAKMMADLGQAEQRVVKGEQQCLKL